MRPAEPNERRKPNRRRDRERPAADVVRAYSPKHILRYSVRADGMKLKTIVFNRASLRRLIKTRTAT
jgi:hypothetical protein